MFEIFWIIGTIAVAIIEDFIKQDLTLILSYREFIVERDPQHHRIGRAGSICGADCSASIICAEPVNACSSGIAMYISLGSNAVTSRVNIIERQFSHCLNSFLLRI